MESRFEKRTLYIQDNAGHYLNKFGIMESTGSKISWNWCAFLLTSAWMIYRKMYKPAAFIIVIEYLLIPVLASLFTGTFSLGLISTSVGSTLSLAVSILLGMFGNYIYMKNIDELMDKEPFDDQFNYQQKYGGVSWKITIIFLIIANAVSLGMENLLF